MYRTHWDHDLLLPALFKSTHASNWIFRYMATNLLVYCEYYAHTYLLLRILWKSSHRLPYWSFLSRRSDPIAGEGVCIHTCYTCIHVPVCFLCVWKYAWKDSLSGRLHTRIYWFSNHPLRLWCICIIFLLGSVRRLCSRHSGHWRIFTRTKSSFPDSHPHTSTSKLGLYMYQCCGCCLKWHACVI